MKLIVNPSRLRDYFKCKFLYFTKWIQNQTLLPGFAFKREFGTLVHEAEAAHDLQNNVKRALSRKCKEWRTSFWYVVGYSQAISLLEVEALKLHEGGSFKDGKGKVTKGESYEAWSSKNLKSSEVLDVEKRLFVDVGPVILAPKLDLVVKTYDWFEENRSDLWVVERKTTMRWDDVSWQERWKLDAQTSLQLLAAEAHYKEEFTGLMVEPIQYTRQKCKDPKTGKEIPQPQPIGKAERLMMKWVRKPKGVMTRIESALEGIALELPRREAANDWPADGMFSGACDFCDLRQFCLGNDTNLYPRSKDDVDGFKRKE